MKIQKRKRSTPRLEQFEARTMMSADYQGLGSYALSSVQAPGKIRMRFVPDTTAYQESAC